MIPNDYDGLISIQWSQTVKWHKKILLFRNVISRMYETKKFSASWDLFFMVTSGVYKFKRL